MAVYYGAQNLHDRTKRELQRLNSKIEVKIANAKGARDRQLEKGNTAVADYIDDSIILPTERNYEEIKDIVKTTRDFGLVGAYRDYSQPQDKYAAMVESNLEDLRANQNIRDPSLAAGSIFKLHKHPKPKEKVKEVNNNGLPYKLEPIVNTKQAINISAIERKKLVNGERRIGNDGAGIKRR